jgi:hypothetical protein
MVTVVANSSRFVALLQYPLYSDIPEVISTGLPEHCLLTQDEIKAVAVPYSPVLHTHAFTQGSGQFKYPGNGAAPLSKPKERHSCTQNRWVE